jgi:tRNA1(Val) A37 N6-methylase TrmN6
MTGTTDPDASAHPDNTTVDAFLGGALHVRQPKSAYRAGLDAVVLAATCQAAAGQRIADCGAGVGTVGLCLARRLATVRVTLIEREPAYARLAAANIAHNLLGDRVDLQIADLTQPLASGPLAPLLATFDHALANPPYQTTTDGTRAANALKDKANAMPANDLDHWVRALAALVKPGGSATVIHRADALPALLAAMGHRFGGLVLRPIHPKSAQPATRIVVQGTRDSRAPLTLAPPLIVHDATGGFTPQVENALRHGAAIPL